MTWQITLNHVCAVLYDISLLAQAYRCMQMLPQTLLFKSAAWHGTFDMIISHLSDLTSPPSDRRCQRRWEMMATLNTRLRWNTENKTTDWKRYWTKDVHMERFLLTPYSHVFPRKMLWISSTTEVVLFFWNFIKEESCLECGCSFHAVQLISTEVSLSQS